MDIDDDDLEYEPDKLNLDLDVQANAAAEEEAEAIPLDPTTFALPPPKELSDAARNGLVRSSVTRIWDVGEEAMGREVGRVKARSEVGVGLPPEEMWMLLVVRMITRGAGGRRDVEVDGRALVQQMGFREDAMRQMVFDYVLDDFSGRCVSVEFIFVLLTDGLRRMRLAIVWMNEEWHNDKIQTKSNPNWVSSSHHSTMHPTHPSTFRNHNTTDGLLA